MKVKANIKNADAKFAFYNTKVRYHDDEFELLKEEDFDPSYMVWVEKPAAKAKTKTKQKNDIIKDDGIDLDLEV